MSWTYRLYVTLLYQRYCLRGVYKNCNSFVITYTRKYCIEDTVSEVYTKIAIRIHLFVITYLFVIAYTRKCVKDIVPRCIQRSESTFTPLFCIFFKLSILNQNRLIKIGRPDCSECLMMWLQGISIHRI